MIRKDVLYTVSLQLCKLRSGQEQMVTGIMIGAADLLYQACCSNRVIGNGRAAVVINLLDIGGGDVLEREN